MGWFFFTGAGVFLEIGFQGHTHTCNEHWQLPPAGPPFPVFALIEGCVWLSPLPVELYPSIASWSACYQRGAESQTRRFDASRLERAVRRQPATVACPYHLHHSCIFQSLFRQSGCTRRRCAPLTALTSVPLSFFPFPNTDVLWKRLFFDRFHACASAIEVQVNFFDEYRDRLCMPHVGDQVQVVWEGTFNLITDTLAAYAGRAWWEAQVVERQPDCSAFKIHYPHWDADTWDEWVPRARIRWPPAPDDGKVQNPENQTCGFFRVSACCQPARCIPRVLCGRR